MQRTIKQVAFPVPVQPKAKRVAAYARVSCGKDAMLHSLSAQISRYSKMIQSHPGWLYCGVYADEAFTGTKENRSGFQNLLAECRAGNIDMIITKSISRFARNTVTLLSTVRELKLLGVDVFFEEQNIHSMSGDGELMLTILASYAQEESLSASENQKWRIKHNFENGIPWRGFMYGYRMINGRYEIVPEEAEIVRRIFAEHRDGKGYATIARKLNEDGIPSPMGKRWCQSSVQNLLSNYTYTGNLLLQTTYRENHITKKTRINKGERPMYHAEDTHDPIIAMPEFRSTQEEKIRRAEHFAKGSRGPRKSYPFTGKLICAGCGKHYRRKITAGGAVWICPTFNTMGKAACPSKQIPEPILMTTAAEVLEMDVFDPNAFHNCVTAVKVENGNKLTFSCTDGTEVDKHWVDRSRAESWTTEMRVAARQKELERRTRNG